MRRMMITSSLLLAMSATAMASQVYKWVDAQGVTHFSAQPPQGQDADSINTATPQHRNTTAKACRRRRKESCANLREHRRSRTSCYR